MAPLLVALLAPAHAAAPTATNGSGSTSEDTAVSITLSANDSDGDALTYSVVSNPAHGTVSISGNRATYTPTANYNGSDSFTWRARDATQYSNTATTTVSISAVNDTPTATARTVTTEPGTAVTFTLSGTDPEGSSLSCTRASSPSQGRLSLSGCSATYTPTGYWTGSDSFTFTVNDGSATSAAATVTINVESNRPPTASNQSVTTNEDTAVNITLSASDPDGDAVTYALDTSPSNGTATLSGSRVTFTPTANWNGVTSFRFHATDTDGNSSGQATVTITVTAVNDAPVATDLTLEVNEGSSGTVTMRGTDVDNSSLTFTTSSSPAHGSISTTGNTVRYTPTAGYSGSDSFNFRCSDGTASDTATVTITVVEANNAPTAAAVSATTNEDTAVNITLQGNDTDGDALTYSISSSPTNGTATVSGRTARYTPNANRSGSDRFRYAVTDGTSTASAWVTVTVSAVNDTPTATAQSVTTNEDTAVNIRLSATDVDSTTFGYTIVTRPSHGATFLTGSQVQYTPQADYTGSDSFTFTATDSGGATSAVATVSITVASVNDAPTAYSSWAATMVNTSVTISAEATDPEGTALTPTLATSATHGTVSSTSGGFRYRSNIGFVGVDSFTFTVTDGSSTSTGTIYVNVHPVPISGRPTTPQFGLNKIAWGLDATDDTNWETSSTPYRPSTIWDTFDTLGIQMHRQMQRADTTWSNVAPGEDNYKDPANNTVIGDLQAEPYATLFELQYASPTPPWCTNPAEFQKEMGADAYAYLDYVLDAYADDLVFYEIGNEMYHWVAADPPVTDASDLPTCYPDDGYSPAEQAVFIEEAYRYIQANDSDARTVLPPLNADSATSEEWLREVVATAGDTDWFDITNYHNYSNWQRSYTAMDDWRSLLTELGIDDKLTLLTETGSTSLADNTSRTDYPNSDESQCADIFRQTSVAWGTGAATVLWHTYLALGESEDASFSGFELIESDGTLKPAAHAVELMTSYLLPFKQVTDYTQVGSVYAFKYLTSAGSTRWVVWGEGDWTVPAGMTYYTDVYSGGDGVYSWTSTSAGATLTLGDTPYLLR